MSEKVFTLRIEETLFNEVKARAERHKRSIAKEIEFIVEETLKADTDYKKRAIDFLQLLKSKNLTKEELAEYKYFVTSMQPQLLEFINLD